MKPRTITIFRRLEMLALIVLGTLSGVFLFGQGNMNIGVINAHLSLAPSWTGSTIIDLGPVGSIGFHSHKGPLAVNVKVNSLSAQSAGELLTSEQEIEGITKNASETLKSTFLKIAWHSLIGGALLSFMLVLISFRRFKIAVYASLISILLNGLVGSYAYLTYRPATIKQPVYKGLVASAPSLIGSAQDIADDFNLYRDQMDNLLENVSKLYSASSNLPNYHVSPETVSLLHVSDIHLNPEAWNLITQLVREFKIDAIIDTGDISDHGSVYEDSFYTEIPKLKIPYFYIRGNHDSIHTQEVIAGYPNARVLTSGEIVNFQGLNISGIGDPRFTPDKTKNIIDKKVTEAVAEFAKKIKGREVDIALMHDPAPANLLDGVASYILAGHIHRRTVTDLPLGSLLMTQGSTGGSGLRMLTNKEVADPLMATILYFDKKTRALKAYDEVTMGGLGSASIQISRKLPKE